MGKIDWYILKKFLVTFFFCMMLFMIVAIAVDSSEKTDDFVKSGLSSWDIIRLYYFGFVPHIWGLLFPLFVFIAVIFFTSKMAGKSEIIAILASGTTYNRMLRPYVIGGLFLGVALWFGYRYLIPKANSIRTAFQAKYIDNDDPSKSKDNSNNYYRRVDPQTYVGIKNYDMPTKTAQSFFLDRVRNGKVYYNIRASAIQWDTAVNKWKLLNAVERKVDSLGETTKEYPSLIINISLKPEELRRDEYLKDKLSTPDLIAFIRQEEVRGTEGLSTLKVERYRRTAAPAAVLLLTIIGAVIASRRVRGGSGAHLALGIVIGVLFIMSDRFSTVFATKSNLPALLAAWIPNIVFSFVAYFLYKRTPK